MKNKKDKKQKKNKKADDLTSYFNPDLLNYDVDGSYTGMTSGMYYGDEDDEPIQDADDL